MVNTLIQYPIVMKVVDRTREPAERKESELFSRSNERVTDVICLLLRWEEYLCGLAACHSLSLSHIQIYPLVLVIIRASTLHRYGHCVVVSILRQGVERVPNAIGLQYQIH